MWGYLTLWLIFNIIDTSEWKNILHTCQLFFQKNILFKKYLLNCKDYLEFFLLTRLIWESVYLNYSDRIRKSKNWFLHGSYKVRNPKFVFLYFRNSSHCQIFCMMLPSWWCGNFQQIRSRKFNSYITGKKIKTFRTCRFFSFFSIWVLFQEYSHFTEELVSL